MEFEIEFQLSIPLTLNSIIRQRFDGSMKKNMSRKNINNNNNNNEVDDDENGEEEIEDEALSLFFMYHFNNCL